MCEWLKCAFVWKCSCLFAQAADADPCRRTDGGAVAAVGGIALRVHAADVAAGGEARRALADAHAVRAQRPRSAGLAARAAVLTVGLEVGALAGDALTGAAGDAARQAHLTAAGALARGAELVGRAGAAADAAVLGVVPEVEAGVAAAGLAGVAGSVDDQIADDREIHRHARVDGRRRGQRIARAGAESEDEQRDA